MPTRSLYYNTRANKRVPKDYGAVKKADERRVKLLADARLLSPVNTVLRADKLGQTVIATIVLEPVTWFVFACYFTTAALTRYEVISFSDREDEAFEGAGMLITFMIVFCERRAQPRP